MPTAKEAAAAIFVAGWFPLMAVGAVAAVVGVMITPPNPWMGSIGIFTLFGGLIWARVVGLVVFGDRRA